MTFCPCRRYKRPLPPANEEAESVPVTVRVCSRYDPFSFPLRTALGPTSPMTTAPPPPTARSPPDGPRACSARRSEIEVHKGMHDGTNWDQFAVNATRFGYTSTWDESLYTTKLDTSKMTAEQQKDAARIAREIERVRRPFPGRVSAAVHTGGGGGGRRLGFGPANGWAALSKHFGGYLGSAPTGRVTLPG